MANREARPHDFDREHRGGSSHHSATADFEHAPDSVFIHRDCIGTGVPRQRALHVDEDDQGIERPALGALRLRCSFFVSDDDVIATAKAEILPDRRWGSTRSWHWMVEGSGQCAHGT